jgi:ATP-dependent Clp protease ATP-binding subunit ClpC
MRNTHYITENDVAKAVSDITGINVAQVTRHESDILLQLEDSLRMRVLGQETPVSALAGAIRRGKAGLRDPKRPIGSFLFTGPTGVGKTELCLALAATLFQQKDALIRLDMSEYMEASSVSKMLGAAPGYIGYGDGGTLADNIRTKPYAVVLLDEIEKAHPDVLNVLLQILDAGSLTDSKGRKVSFQNTVIVMTSNVGARSIAEAKAAIGFGQASAKADTKKDAMNELQAAFRPEFLNRIDDIIVFGQLSPADVKAIAGKYIGELAERLLANGVTLRVSDAAITQLASMGFDERYGARPLKRVIQNHLEDKIADFILRGDLGAEDAIDCDFMDGTIMYKLSSTVGAAN